MVYHPDETKMDHLQEQLKVTHCLRQKGPSEALRKAAQGPVGFANGV
jgi:hypothetical protein